jgi:thiol-disulfide isomerase/thioredoxin
MKKFRQSLVKIMLLLLLVFSGYYLFILNSNGTTAIHYIEPEEKYKTFKALLQDPALKGKIVYVDVWRTTCGPCLEEFKVAPQLKQHFKTYGNKIAFLYIGTDISVPGEEFRWKRMIEKKNITGYHYFITRNFLGEMWREVVKDPAIPPQFPQYFIVNATGDVVDFNAPRPTDARVFAALEQVLEQKP